jgi:hypothetical protein
MDTAKYTLLLGLIEILCLTTRALLKGGISMTNTVRAENNGSCFEKTGFVSTHIYHEGSYVLISAATQNLHLQDIPAFAFVFNDNRFLLKHLSLCSA